MVGVFITFAIIYIGASLWIRKDPTIIAGYTPDTPKKLIEFIQKSFFIVGFVYVPLSIIPMFIKDNLTLTCFILAPTIVSVIIISIASHRYK